MGNRTQDSTSVVEASLKTAMIQKLMGDSVYILMCIKLPSDDGLSEW